jgi:hypothetical protein
MFKPYESHKISVKPYWHTGQSGPSNVINDINNALNNNKRLMVSVSSANLANEIINNLPANKSYKLYTGEDYKIDDNNQSSMRQTKKHDFKDVVNSWASVDIVVHTSTLQAGVDYSVNTEDTFDQFIHVYTGMSSTPDQFIQSTL